MQISVAFAGQDVHIKVLACSVLNRFKTDIIKTISLKLFVIILLISSKENGACLLWSKD